MRDSSRLKHNVGGQRFGRLMALSHLGSGVWDCICDCGQKTTVAGRILVAGDTKSCGCLKRERDKTFNLKHGKRHTLTYEIWKSMRARCNNQNNKAFHNYGGRGITVCRRWNDYQNFLNDMGECPSGYSIDRIDVDGNYEPSNCRWIPFREQARTRRDALYTIQKTPEILRLRSLGLSQQVIADSIGINQTTISRVLARHAA